MTDEQLEIERMLGEGCPQDPVPKVGHCPVCGQEVPSDQIVCKLCVETAENLVVYYLPPDRDKGG